MRKRTTLTRFAARNAALIFGTIGLGLLAYPQTVIAQRNTSADNVKITATAGKLSAAGKQEVTLKIDIKKNWYIYANPVGFDDLAPAATKVSFTFAGKKVAAKVNYPKGNIKIDDKISYRIYEDKVTITAIVDRPAGAGKLVATVQVNSCDKVQGICLRPGKKKVIIK